LWSNRLFDVIQILSLWSLNPFPSIVKVAEYPEVALADVLRGQRECFDEHFPHDGRNMFKPEFLKDAEGVRRLTIDQKVAFWHEVMQRARSRRRRVLVHLERVSVHRGGQTWTEPREAGR
jgi:hypothetical protein